MTEIQDRAKLIKDLLTKAVREALERKRRLGQYAVIARDGKPSRLPPDEIESVLRKQRNDNETEQV